MSERRWIIGYGSLLSQASARNTFPTLQSFQSAWLPAGYRRVFAHASPLFLIRKLADLDQRELAAASVEPAPEGVPLVVSVFHVAEAEMPALYAREEEFEFVEVPMTLRDGTYIPNATLCVRGSDSSYRKKLGSQEKWNERVAQYGLDSVWTDEVKPCRLYLRHCVLAAQTMGELALDDFLDHSYLSDRKTTIRQYLDENPAIMKEPPPPQFEKFYSG